MILYIRIYQWIVINHEKNTQHNKVFGFLKCDMMLENILIYMIKMHNINT